MTAVVVNSLFSLCCRNVFSCRGQVDFYIKLLPMADDPTYNSHLLLILIDMISMTATPARERERETGNEC